MSVKPGQAQSRGPSLGTGCVVLTVVTTTAPSDSLSAAGHFPGSPVIGRHAPDPAGSGPSRASPVPTTAFWPFHVLYAGGFLGTRSRFPGAFHGLRPIHTGSAPSLPAHRRSLDDAADFASCCGPVSRSASLRPRPLDRSRRLRYRGPWRLPGPDFHRLAIESLSLGYVMITPSRS